MSQLSKNDIRVADELWAILEQMENREVVKTIVTLFIFSSPEGIAKAQNLIREYGGAA